MRRTIAILAGVALALSLAPAASAAPAPASPGGRLLVLDPTGYDPNSWATLSSVRPDGTDKQDLHLTLFWYAGPDYSPDGTKFVFVSPGCCDGVDIANADGTGATEIVEGPSAPSFPRWSPRGDLISLESDADIWTLSPLGPSVRWGTITAPGDFNNLVSEWAPTGRTVAVAKWTENPNIWLYPASGDGSRARQLTHQTGWNPYRMTWSPDGKTIIVESGGDLYKVNANNGKVTDITNTPAVNESSPVYSPDGSLVAYAAQSTDEGSIPVVRLMNATTFTSRATGITGTPTSWRPQP
ncbi:TolB family protein [Hamadaea tsunoensis]|uniref:TolB family protein n=1 Tax=Hamadaea tsunoensis TaxID=53368 RepID=UPI0004248DA7|nr:PD40 domain-containing protein [Hamadaea tsunoensis]